MLAMAGNCPHPRPLSRVRARGEDARLASPLLVADAYRCGWSRGVHVGKGIEVEQGLAELFESARSTGPLSAR